MMKRRIPLWVKVCLVTGFFGVSGTLNAQIPWADNQYAYRRPVTLVNPTSQAFNAGDIVAYSYVPQAGPLADKTRADGKDVKLFYYNGTANAAVPQALLDMGTGAGKILFSLPAGLTAAPPYLTENQNAGPSDFASILAATPANTLLTMTHAAYSGGEADDADTTVTLPFSFPFKNGTSNKLGIAVDGYVQPGGPIGTSYLRYDIDAPAAFAAAYVIGPWCADLGVYTDATHTDRGVYYTADANRAIIRWKAVDTGATSGVEMNFAVILKPDGSITYVYGGQVDLAPNQTVKVGVGAGATADSIVNTPSASFAGHAMITYAQSFGSTQATGYWVYYGNATDDGKTGRTAPDPTKLVSYTFDDNTTQGWEPVTAMQCNPLTVTNGVMEASASASGAHPSATAAGQTAVLGDQAVYAKFKPTGGDNEVGIMARADAAGHGYGLLIDGYGSLEIMIGRNGSGGTNDYGTIGSGISYIADPNKWHFGVLQATGTGSSITLKGRAWPDGSADPGWQLSNAAPSDRLFDTGTAGLAFYNGGSTEQIDWLYVTAPTAETISSAAGDEEVNPSVCIIQGTVRDRWYHLRQASMKITLTDADGNYLYSTATNANGVYRVYVASAGNVTVAALGGGRSARATVIAAGGQTITQDLSIDIAANGDCEIPTSDNSWPDQWERYYFGTPPGSAGLSREQNHTPDGHWSLKISGVTADSTSFQTGIGRSGNNFFQHPIITGCSYTISAWVYFTNPGDQVRLRLRSSWPISGFYVKAGSPPPAENENKGGLDGSGNVPVGQWYEMRYTAPFAVGSASNPLPIEYGIYTFASQTGNVYLDDVTMTPTPVALNEVIAKAVDDQGNAIPGAWMGTMLYGGKLFSNPSPADEFGIARVFTSSSTAVSLGAWQGPISRANTNLDVNGALVGVAAATPVPYDPNLSTPTATLVVTRKAVNVLSAGNGTMGLINGDSKWPAYLIDKRIDKTGATDAGDSTNPADWVQFRRCVPFTDDAQKQVARIWDGNVDAEANGWGTGGLRGIFSKDTNTDIPERYRTSTVDIDMGSTQTIDQLEMAYFFPVNKHRVWISDTPFTWNVELPNSGAVLDTTTDATSVKGQGFSAANAPYDSPNLNAYQIYRFSPAIKGRYLRMVQDGAPYGDGHQIMFEMRAMSSAAYPKPVHGRVLTESGTPVQGAFVGPFPKGGPGNYAVTAADGTFTWSGPGVPTQLYVHVEAKQSDNTYAATPYLMAGPFTVTPIEGGVNIGDLYVHPSGGNAMVGATTVVIANDGNLGTEVYNPSFCDPSETGHPTSMVNDQLAGDTHQWAAKPSINASGDACIGDITTGSEYLRVGLESTLAAPADLDEIDIYWFQNGYPAGFYVQTTSDSGTTWNTVFQTTNYAGNYNDAYPGDGLRVSPVKFATQKGVDKVRVIFSTLSNRDNPENEFIISEIVALKHKDAAMTPEDVKTALQIAAGLQPAPLIADSQFTRLNVVNTGSSAGKIDLVDAVTLAKTTIH